MCFCCQSFVVKPLLLPLTMQVYVRCNSLLRINDVVSRADKFFKNKNYHQTILGFDDCFKDNIPTLSATPKRP